MKLLGEQLSVFKVRLAGRWSEDEGWVEVDGLPDREELLGMSASAGDVEDLIEVEDL